MKNKSRDTRLTAEQYMALPRDAYRYLELVRGRIRDVREPWPAHEHGVRQFHLAYLLKKYLEANPIARLSGDASVTLRRNSDTVRAPDIYVIRNERYPRDYVGGPIFEVAPDLIVEIRSPSETAGILRAKLADYFAAGTSVVWVVEERKRRVTIHTKDAEPRIIQGNERLTGEPVLPGFSCTLNELFSDA
jgi:Uma2 family endonuclease